MKITVLGAGAIGSAVAYDLCKREAVTRVHVCEARPVTLRAFRATCTDAKLRTYEADARDEQTLEPLLSGSAAVVSCVAPELNPRLARLALRVGAHFVDLGNPRPVAEQLRTLGALAEERQRWVITGAGLAPGLVNMLCMRGLERMDEARAIRVLVGDVPLEAGETFTFRLAHSAEKLIDDYTTPTTVLRRGKPETVAPLTGVEPVEVEGFGPLEAFYADAGLSDLARALAGRVESLDVKVLRPAGHAAQMRFLFELGFADRTTLDVRTHMTYRDVLVRRLRRRLGGPYRDAVLVRVVIEGLAGGEAGTLTYTLTDRYDEATGYSAMQRCTGFPAATTAAQLAKRRLGGGGVAAPERVLPHSPFFDALTARGVSVTEHWAPASAPEPVAR